MLQGIEPDYNVIIGWMHGGRSISRVFQRSIRWIMNPFDNPRRFAPNVPILRFSGRQPMLLNLRGLMDKDEGPTPDQTPNTFRVAVPHLIMAALTLAADTFFNPTAPDADAREVKILTAYDILENATEESCGFRLNNLRTLMSMLGNRQPPTLPRPGTSLASPEGSYASPRGTPFERQSFDSLLFRGIGQEMLNERGPWSRNWPQLWSEFLVVAPKLDLTYWEILFDSTDVV